MSSQRVQQRNPRLWIVGLAIFVCWLSPHNANAMDPGSPPPQTDPSTGGDGEPARSAGKPASSAEPWWRKVPDGEATGRAEPLPKPRWYGWEILLVDLGALTLTTSGLAMSSTARGRTDGFGQHVPGWYDAWPAPIGVGMAALVLGGPTVHFAERRRTTALLSLGLRLVMPLLGLAFVAASGPCNCGTGDPGMLPFVLGSDLAAVFVVPFDVAYLAWKDAPPTNHAMAQSTSASSGTRLDIRTVRDSKRQSIPSLGVAVDF